MASNKKPHGEQPANKNDTENPIENPIENLPTGSKRPADQTPLLGNNKRPALVNITNVLTPNLYQEENITIVNIEEEENITIVNIEEEEKPLTPRSNLNAREDTPFLTAQEWFTPIDVELVDQEQQDLPTTPRHAAIFTLDLELNSEDPMQTWPYAMDVFIYQREREKMFIIMDYMSIQVDLTPWKRTLLISWMVTLHQVFGTFRETLFLSVKIVDLYLCRFMVEESMLQLLGATAIYIASKFEERETLLIEALLQTCYREYSGQDLVQMERKVLFGIGFDLGIPISYRFLRRYARSANVPEPIWTLASYILELDLLEYNTIGHSDSQLAAAALFIALRMRGEAGKLDEDTWNPVLVFYSGYELPEFAWLVPVLNAVLHRGDCDSVKAVRSLYSTPVLYEVAKVPPLTTKELFRHNRELYNYTDP